MIDYHIHTMLCNHARGGMEKYVLEAVKKGLLEICFLDHLTLSGEGALNTMQKSEVGLYFQAIQIMKKKYSDKISIKSGLEIDFDEECIPEIERITSIFDFDAIAGSVHFVKGLNLASRKSIEAVKKFSPDEIVSAYIEKLLRMLDFDFFDIICHIDIPKKFGGKNFTNDMNFDAVLRRTAEKGKTVEINTSGFYHPAGEFYPCMAILEKCCSLGIPVTLGSDAHSPEETGRDIDIAVKTAKAAGYKGVSAFSSRQPYLVNFDLMRSCL